MRVMIGPFIEGQKRGMLTLLRREIRKKSSGSISWWLCRCECGVEKWIRQHAIRPSRTVSCGCLNRSRSLAGFRRTHGERRTREYGAWCRMIRRCTDEKCDKFKYYGGRGVTVSEEWRHDYPAFLSHIGRCPDGFSLDRINTGGNYEPGNVKWSSRKEQMFNRRCTVIACVNGEHVSLKEACRLLGFNYKTAHNRMRRGAPLPPALAVALVAEDRIRTGAVA